ncbi:HAD family hydrolase [Niveibacterium umoris]|uniref:phosphoglycolate phosphatase n=2 Tax=Niveibacterium umoris TaxID=1193620 RepID=A0A840BKH6_9RHOO|nr:HAD family hydrolase [Niveibacterium umoris]MBB4011386.1 phosphoglycolate phosphatase [Niveibacterium umoris]
MYTSKERLILFDADGTTIDAFSAIDTTFARHGMEIGDLERFQKRRKLFKYLGGIKEFPGNLKKQFGKHSRKQILTTLTEVYREEAQLYPGVASLMRDLIQAPGIRVGLVTRNVTFEPATTLRQLFARHDIDLTAIDFMACLSLSDEKKHPFKMARERFAINPARCYACGDEVSDFNAAVASGMHPFIVSYGFEDHKRLTKKFEVPDEVISRSPEEFCERVRNALDLAAPQQRQAAAA